jgi:hypothetical protein
MSYSTYSEYLAHPRFRKSVKAAQERSGGICEFESNGRLRCRNRATDPHHIKYCKWGEFDPAENLIMLCRECHEEAHRCDKCGNVTLKAQHIKRGVKTCC